MLLPITLAPTLQDSFGKITQSFEITESLLFNQSLILRDWIVNDVPLKEQPKVVNPVPFFGCFTLKGTGTSLRNNQGTWLLLVVVALL